MHSYTQKKHKLYLRNNSEFIGSPQLLNSPSFMRSPILSELSLRPQRRYTISRNHRSVTGKDRDELLRTILSQEKPQVFPNFESVPLSELPYDRKEVKKLVDELDTHLNKAYSNHKNDPESLFKASNEVYSECIKGISQQIRFNCKERGQLLERIWGATQEAFAKNLKVSQAKEGFLRESFELQQEKLQQRHKAELDYENRKSSAAIKEAILHKKGMETHKEALLEFKKKDERLRARLLTTQKHYETIKKEIYILKEENRILQTKVDSCVFDVIEDSKGYLVPKDRAFLRVKRRRLEDLQRELVQDPVLAGLDLSQEDSLPQDIQNFGTFHIEKHEFGFFSKPDYKDQGTNPLYIELADSTTQSNVTELCGESTGIKQRPKRLQLTRTLKRKLTIKFMMEKSLSEIDSPQSSVEEENLREQVKKHRQVKNTINSCIEVSGNQQMKDQLNYENMPHTHAMELLLRNLQLAAKFVQNHPLEGHECDESSDDEVQHSEFIPHVKRNSQELPFLEQRVETAIRRVSHTPALKLKKIMAKKKLFKLITTIYEELLREYDTREKFSVFVYKTLLRRFVMPKTVDYQFEYLLCSCVKYKALGRVRLFSRFLGLFKPLDLQELTFYVECMKLLLHSPSGKSVPSSEDAEFVLVPYVRCLECLKAAEKRFSESDLQELKRALCELRQPDASGLNKSGVLRADEFIGLLVERLSHRKSQSFDYLKALFEASDLNNDGFLQFQEFRILVNHVSDKDFPVSELRRIFNANAETFLSETETEVKAISLESLSQLNYCYKVFSFEAVQRFSGISSQEEAVAKLKGMAGQEDGVFGDIYWRFSECEEWQENLAELREIIKLLKNRIISKYDPFVDWLGFCLLDRESREMLAKERVSAFLPIISAAAFFK